MNQLAPSILAADFGRLNEQVQQAAAAGAPWVHIDVMDGQFVPNISIGIPIVQALKPLKAQAVGPLDVHMMVDRPGRFVDAFVAAGADIITVHVEATAHLHRVIQQIKQANVKVGVALNPHTPVSALEVIVDQIDLLLIMSVNPGFGGQSFIEHSLSKIKQARVMLDQACSTAYLQVDGGIKLHNVQAVCDAGADVLVAGSAVYGGGQSIAENVAAFQRIIN